MLEEHISGGNLARIHHLRDESTFGFATFARYLARADEESVGAHDDMRPVRPAGLA